MTSTSEILKNIPKNPKISDEPHESDEGADDTENRPKNNVSTPKNKPIHEDLLENILKEDVKKILG